MPSTLVEDEEPDEPPKGALETGLWCGRCFLPSAIRFAVVGISAATGRIVPAGTAIMCLDCGAQVSEDGDPIG